MIVECDQCHAKYHYDEARFGGKPSKKLRCSKCRAIFEVFNTRAYEAQPPVRPPIAAGETDDAPPAELREAPGAASRPASGARPPDRSKLPTERKLSLAVIAGPTPGGCSRSRSPRIVIGREEVDLALDDPEISRQHAAIEVRGRATSSLLDLGSTNGTFVGDQAVSRGAAREPERVHGRRIDADADRDDGLVGSLESVVCSL